MRAKKFMLQNQEYYDLVFEDKRERTFSARQLEEMKKAGLQVEVEDEQERTDKTSM